MSAPARERRGNTQGAIAPAPTAAAEAGGGGSPSATPQGRHRPVSTPSPSAARKQRPTVSASSTTRPTPLALALQAQWTLLQQNLQLGAIPITAERDLLRVLESLPGHRNAILSDVEGVLPYILAFAVAPIPSERTQVIALGAMQATVGSLVAVWGRKAAAVLVHDFLALEHNALHALEVTLSVALGDEDEGEDEEEKDERWKNSRDEGIKMQKRDRPTAVTETRSAIIGNALELILMMVTVSKPTAAAALTHPKLIEAIGRCLSNASPVQACDVASILHSLSAVEGAAEVLVACKVYYSATLYIRTSVRGGIGTSPNATVTALCMFLRLAARLAECPAAFAVLQEDPVMPQVMEELLRSHWGEVVELSCRWLATTVAHHAAHSSELIAAILYKTQAGERLASMLLWPSSMAAYAAAAALCWRWFALASPTVTSSYVVTNPNALLSLLQAFATLPLCRPRAAAEPHDGGSEGTAARGLLVEVACTLGLCHGLAPRETRAAMRRIALHRLSPVTQAEVQRRVASVFANVSESYFEQYPAVTVPHGRRQANNASSVASASVGLSSIERNITEFVSDTESDDDNVTKQHLESGRRSHTLRSSAQWHEFLLRSLTRLFRGTARGPVSASILHGHQLGAATAGASAVRRIPASTDTTQRSQFSYHSHHQQQKQPEHGAVAIATCPPSLSQGVVQRAEQMGGTFYIDSIRVILRLAHRYKHAFARETRHGAATSHSTSTHSFNRTGKAPNPWAPPEKVESSRRWSVEDVLRADTVLFYISYDNIVPEMAEALAAVEEHTRSLARCLQLCPTKAVQRRCLLNDLYMHVYPKIHMILRFIQHHMGQSRPVLQIIVENDRAVHSGNILELYEAIGHCIGDSVEFRENTSIESH